MYIISNFPADKTETRVNVSNVLSKRGRRKSIMQSFKNFFTDFLLGDPKRFEFSISELPVTGRLMNTIT